MLEVNVLVVKRECMVVSSPVALWVHSPSSQRAPRIPEEGSCARDCDHPASKVG